MDKHEMDHEAGKKGKEASLSGTAMENGPGRKNLSPLPNCGKPHTAENHRLHDEDDACDDGVN